MFPTPAVLEIVMRRSKYAHSASSLFVNGKHTTRFTELSLHCVSPTRCRTNACVLECVRLSRAPSSTSDLGFVVPAAVRVPGSRHTVGVGRLGSTCSCTKTGVFIARRYGGTSRVRSSLRALKVLQSGKWVRRAGRSLRRLCEKDTGGELSRCNGTGCSQTSA